MTRLGRGYNISSDALVSILVWLEMDEQIRSFILPTAGEEDGCSSESSTPTKNEP
jgi:hypothetical protein